MSDQTEILSEAVLERVRGRQLARACVDGMLAKCGVIVIPRPFEDIHKGARIMLELSGSTVVFEVIGERADKLTLARCEPK